VNQPRAVVVHSSGERQRIRIPSRRGDHDFFEKVRQAAEQSPFELVRANVLTGSILFQGKHVDREAVTRFGRDSDLFRIASTMPAPALARRISAPLTTLDDTIKRLSAGQLDLPGALFILLLFTAVYEIARGRLRTPPWYTAFWYAFGLFTKTLIDRDKDDLRQNPRSGA
jgi:hypothetical protein